MSYGIDGDNRYELVTIRVGDDVAVVRAEHIQAIRDDATHGWIVELIDGERITFDDSAGNPTINGHEINPRTKGASETIVQNISLSGSVSPQELQDQINEAMVRQCLCHPIRGCGL